MTSDIQALIGKWRLKPSPVSRRLVVSDLPVIPPLTPEQKRQRNTPDSNSPVAKCGECGMLLYRVMGYVCGYTYCPVQPKVT